MKVYQKGWNMSNENNKFGYKAYNPGLVCRGYQYKEGETYKKNGHGICCHGVTHYCVNPFDVLDYYPLVNEEGKFSDFTTVEAIDEPITDDNKKFATSTIKIVAKLGFDGFIKACVDFLYEKTIKNMPESKIKNSSGDYAKIGSSGDYAQIGSSGDYAQIGSSGNSAQIGSSGYSAQIDVSGTDSVCAAIGIESKIKAKVGNWITLAEWEYNDEKKRYVPICVKSAKVDSEILKEDTWYMLKDGEFVEVDNG